MSAFVRIDRTALRKIEQSHTGMCYGDEKRGPVSEYTRGWGDCLKAVKAAVSPSKEQHLRDTLAGLAALADTAVGASADDMSEVLASIQWMAARAAIGVEEEGCNHWPGQKRCDWCDLGKS
jgi:hypothetical protein